MDERALEERITLLETEVAGLRRHSNETDALIVRLTTVIAVQAGIPSERIDRIFQQENDKVINKLIDKLHGDN
jgi:hypothetical protein